MEYQLVEKETNEIITPHWIGLAPNGELYSGGMNVTSQYIIRWFIGIRDKNGKKIYSGDILKITCDFELRKGIETDKVIFSDMGWWQCSDWTLGELVRNEREGEQEFEVIGNIYKNPELLSN